ncbi:MAG: DUF1573 domain-containing protein [Candidatus Omnitrophica bacterium]|nr:DUF1573 domain-containing protein [Candidatus Omnitrophota bacterium]
MRDPKKKLTDSEVKTILERTPMTERLEDFERQEMKEAFLEAVRTSSYSSTPLTPHFVRRIPYWVGVGGAIAACAILFFFAWSNMGKTPWSGDEGIQPTRENSDFDGRAYFKRDADSPKSATAEIDETTTGVQSSDRVRVNRVPWESLCGPRSIWVAAARLGVNLDLNEIIESCDMSEKGCSMWDLKRAIEPLGFTAKGMRLDPDSLFDLESPAILLVNGNHFCCIDPTESSEDGRIRYYDPPITATWVSKDEIQRKWNGEALVLERQKKTPKQGPSLKLDTAFNDLGMVTDKSAETGYFPIHNEGDSPLEILELNHSCGCIEAEATLNPIPPGESALVVAKMALQGFDGIRSEMIEVVTNDPQNPSEVIVLQAEHKRTLVLSTETIDFGVLTATSPSDRQFEIEDRSGENIPIRSVEAVLNSSVESPPVVGVSREDLKPDPKDMGRKYRFNLLASASPQTPLGAYEGKIQIVAGQDGDRVLEIPFQVAVESSYLISPSHISFGVVKQGEEIERSLVIRNRGNREIRLVGHEVKCDDSKCSLRMVNPTGRLKEVPVDLTFSVPELDTGETRVAKGSLVLHPEEGPDFEVPWSAIVKKGR